MTNPLTVFAIIEASEADRPHIEAAVAILACSSLDEPGCLQYDVYASVKEPGRLIIHEIWQDEGTLDLHRRSESVVRFKQRLVGRNAKLTACVYRKLELPGKIERPVQDCEEVFR